MASVRLPDKAYASIPQAWRDHAEGLLSEMLRRAIALIAVGFVATVGSVMLVVYFFDMLTPRAGARLLVAPFICAAIAAWGCLELRVWNKARRIVMSRGEQVTIMATSVLGGRTDAIRQLRRIAGAQRVGLELRTATEIGGASLRSAWERPSGLQAGMVSGILFGTLRKGAVVLVVSERGALAGMVASGWRRPLLPDEG